LNAQIFELEQALYRAEKIEFTPFTSNFNKAHLELTEKVINAFEEETEKFEQNNEHPKSFFETIFAQLYKNQLFSAHPGQPIFQIEHRFGKVFHLSFPHHFHLFLV
jgi:hypothetical protein